MLSLCFVFVRLDVFLMRSCFGGVDEFFLCLSDTKINAHLRMFSNGLFQLLIASAALKAFERAEN